MNKADVLRVANECGATHPIVGGNPAFVLTSSYEFTGCELERFAAAMYAKGAEDMRERAKVACKSLEQGRFYPVIGDAEQLSADDYIDAIAALPITTNTEGEQGND